MEGHLLYAKPTDLNINLIYKLPSLEHLRIMFDHISEYSGPAKFTHKLSQLTR